MKIPRKTLINYSLVLFLILMLVGVFIHFHCSKRELIICFAEDRWHMEQHIYRYFFKNDIIIGQDLSFSNDVNSKFYLYKITDKEEDKVLFKYMNTKGDKKTHRPGDSFARIELFAGRKKPEEIRFYDVDYDKDLEVLYWFKEIRNIICKEENRIDINQLPAYFREAEWYKYSRLDKIE